MYRFSIEENPVLKHTVKFSIALIEFCDHLNSEKRFVLANQLLKAGTSIGANAMEAQHSESRHDFIHKMKIAAKEASETQYWLLLCKYSPLYPDPDHLLNSLYEIQKILGSIINSSKKAVK